MENQRQKWVNLVLLSVAVLVAAVLFVGLSKIAAVYNLESSVKQIDMIIRFGSIALGAALGFGLYLNDQSNAFLNEVVLEMSRVTWPTQKETINATIWVVLFVIIVGAVLGAFDSFCAWLMRMVL
ncbi:MAG: preprotein translocase subunit SecE [Bdellovibrionales bacterium]|nr:preprotein translocase subunit SecE [Bdellovibrionales bacterium]